jgi:ParB family chromosome partitioning protein
MPPRKRRKAAAPASRGLEATELARGSPSAEAAALSDAIGADGGSPLAVYRDPLGGHWQILAALPIEKVEPTPFQRDLSDAHVKRLGAVLDALGRFLDPIVAVRTEDGRYWTPNGNHRLSSMRRLGAKSIVALVLPETEVAYKIEEAAFVTLGVCYERNGRFAGGAYHPILKRVDSFVDDPLPRALQMREKRAERVIELEDAVSAAMKALKERGFESPYLRAFVVARINPLRFHKGEPPSFDATFEKMIASAKKFKPESIKAEQVARAAGAPDDAD